MPDEAESNFGESEDYLSRFELPEFAIPEDALPLPFVDEPQSEVATNDQSWDSAEISKLPSNSTPNSDVTLRNFAHTKDADKHRQAQRFRLWFFAGICLVGGFTILCSCGIIVWYLWLAKAQANSTVLLGFFASTVVEVIGILYVIANYLFPAEHSSIRTSRFSQTK